MTVETTTPRSRRAILAAGLGAGAATVATALARPLAVRATNGDPVLAGYQYTATTVTGFDTTGAGGENALFGQSDSANGVNGISSSGIGVLGASDSYLGVYGNSTSGIGVYGASGSSSGVFGFSFASNQPAILGRSQGASTGVQGYSGSGTTPTPPAKTGVYGYAVQDATARGVTGQSTAGYGISGIASTGRAVNGAATTGHGVMGLANTGIGTRGYAVTGTALYASTSGPKVGTALRAIGRVKFDNCSGVATIAAGHNSVTVTPGSDMLATSAVVATLMGSAGGTTTVHRVVVNAVADTFTIYLTANATAAVTVAWHVFG
jgi:hypothetical protein